MVTKSDIEEAYRRIRDDIVCTPLVFSQKMSRLCGCRTLFKLENFQTTGSFKDRGALNKLLSLSPEERAKGVIAASAGNHAQAVAYHSQRLGLKAKIIMPEGTPLIKVVSTQGYGAEVILEGETVDDSYDRALDIARREGSILIPPFDDPWIIAGQGTIGIEILESDLAAGIDAVLCPIGGGGLISGLAVYLKESLPEIRIIGVEAASAASMKKSLESGGPVRLESASSLADGIAVKKVGGLTYEIVKKYVDEVVAVEEDEIASAILLLLEIEKIIAEGAGAVSLAALLNRKVRLEGQKTLCIVSGGNIDVNTLDRIITRGLAAEGRIARFTVRLKDRPGALLSVMQVIKKMQVNVLDIIHHRFESAGPFGYVDVSITLETKGHAHIEEVRKTLEDAGYPPCEPVCRF